MQVLDLNNEISFHFSVREIYKICKFTKSKTRELNIKIRLWIITLKYDVTTNKISRYFIFYSGHWQKT